MRGRVKWFNEAKGYGFITPDDQSSDVFVHYSTIEGRGFRTLKSGQRVEFDVESSRRGPAATRVAPMNAPD